MLWTPEFDRTLLSISERLGPVTHARVASEFAISTGIPVTEDMVRNRLRRVRAEMETHEATWRQPEQEATFVLPAPKNEFVGFRQAFFDIETTGLTGIMGRMLVGSIGDNWGNITTRTILDLPGETPLDDSRLAEWYRDELERYDILTGWNSKLFDVPMLNARLLRWSKRPMRQDMMHSDPMYKARGGAQGARIGSSKLDNVAKFFRTPNQKTPLDWDTWQLAGLGDPAAIASVVEHCEADILVLRDVFNHLKPLIRIVHR